MMPWGHFPVAYVPYVLYRLLVDRRLPDRESFVVLMFATQLPDLIDKPLPWTFGLIPIGRMLAHSLVLSPPFVLVVGLLAWRVGYDDLGAVFVFGFLTHPFADSYNLLWQGSEYYFLPNLFWPLVAPKVGPNPDFIVHFARIEASSFVLAALGLFVLAWMFAQPEIQRDSVNHIGPAQMASS